MQFDMNYWAVYASVFFLVIGVSIAVVVLYAWLSSAYFMARDMIRHSREFRELDENRKEMIARGEYHEWVEIFYKGEMIRVCKKTGWVPSMKVYLIKTYLDAKVAAKDQAEKYAKYVDERLSLIAEEFNLEPTSLDEILKRVKDIPSDFTVKNIMSQLRVGDDSKPE